MLPQVTFIAIGLRRALVCAALILAGCNAETPQALIASGKQYVAKNDHAAAVIQFKTALQREPGSHEARILLGEALLGTGDEIGRAHV